MKTVDVIKYFGSAAALARALNCNRSAVSQWGEDVPLARQFQLQVITKDTLKADFTKPERSNYEQTQA